jgi:Tol biopolymer transport system component
VDRRTDVWAFGCVLFEMLAGRRAFEGEEVSDVLARILEREPDYTALAPATPLSIRRLLRRCLEKDRKRRMADMADVRLELDEASTAPPGEGAPSRTASRAWMAAALVLLVIALALGVALLSRRTQAAPDPVRFIVLAPDQTHFEVRGGAFGSPAGNSGTVSPDGRKLIFTLIEDSGARRLWIQHLDSLIAQPLSNTEGANLPFWSPDSRFVAFYADGKLKKVDVTGGAPVTLCDAPSGRGGAWNRDDVILFNAALGEGLSRIPGSGGTPVPVTTLEPGQRMHRSPSFLPDGRDFVFRVQGTASGVFLGSLDSDTVSLLLDDADANAVYAPPGYLLFVRDGALMAQAFDEKGHQFTAEPVLVANQVATDLANGLSAFSASDTGVLTYRAGPARNIESPLVWLDRSGRQVGAAGPAGLHQGVAIAPDGQRAVIHRHERQGGDLWLLARDRGALSRFTFDPSQDNSAPVWSPDGSRIVYTSRRNGAWGLYVKQSNNTGGEERLLESASPVTATSWSPDGHSLVYVAIDPATNADLWLLPLEGDRTPVPLVTTPFAESHGQISPDGRWLAYSSNESGRAEVYVESLPRGAGKWPVSIGGGGFPRWRRDSRELFFLGPADSGGMKSVAIIPRGTMLEVGTPVDVFPYNFTVVTHSTPYQPFDVSGDEQWLLPSLPSEDMTSSVVVVLNWTSGLGR